MLRVVGADPGTSSLDLVLLADGEVAGQAHLTPDAFRADPEVLATTLRSWGSIDLVAGPSGYGLPLVRADVLTDAGLDAMTLLRPDERGAQVGVIGFRAWVRALIATGLPAVFLPGGIHLPTIPAHRKLNAIDMGTADKVAVAALALRFHADASGQGPTEATFALVEVGSAFTAILVVAGGALVDASAGTRGPIGLRSSGAWDGEVAYRLAPLSKADLFRGGLDDLGPSGMAAFLESIIKHLSGLRAVTPIDSIYLSGAGAGRPEIAGPLLEALGSIGRVAPLPSLRGASVKHAAQGAALLADGLAGGRNADLVAALALRGASGRAWDHLRIRPGIW